MPWHALAAVLAVRTFGHDWDYILEDDDKPPNEFRLPNASPLVTHELAVNWKRC